MPILALSGEIAPKSSRRPLGPSGTILSEIGPDRLARKSASQPARHQLKNARDLLF